jgi:hypothetical protein
VMKDWRLDRSSSWTFVLPSLNIRHHFLKFDSFITPFPYIAISYAFKNPITARTSHSAAFSIFLLIFEYHKQFQNNRISPSFTWIVTKRLLRPFKLEMMQFIDLRKCYAQTIFSFCTTLVWLLVPFIELILGEVSVTFGTVFFRWHSFEITFISRRKEYYLHINILLFYPYFNKLFRSSWKLPWTNVILQKPMNCLAARNVLDIWRVE